MLLAVITAGDAECRAVVYLGRGAITFTRGTWGQVRGNLMEAGLAVGSPAPVAGAGGRLGEGREGHLFGEQPAERDTIEAG